jgi:predicted HNH restriction endonuclease
MNRYHLSPFLFMETIMSILTTLGDLIRGKTDLSMPKRSPQWPEARANYLKIHNKCTVCNGTKNLEVHHVKPFHVHPELELDPTNFITLCESGDNGINCHLLVGHLGNFKSVNLNVLTDATSWNTKLTTRPTDANIVE